MPEEVFLTFQQLPNHGIRFCRVHLNRMIDKGLFPQAVWLSSNRKAWRLADIERWKATRPTDRPRWQFEGADNAAD